MDEDININNILLPQVNISSEPTQSFSSLVPGYELPLDFLDQKEQIIGTCKRELFELNPLIGDIAPGNPKPFSQGEIEKIYRIMNSANLSPDLIRLWFMDLSVEQVRSLNSSPKLRGNLKALLMKILSKDTIDKTSMIQIMDDFSNKLMSDEDQKNQKLKQIYSQFEDNLQKIRLSSQKFSTLTSSEFFIKLFIHESGGNGVTGTAKIFAASGSGSLGISQSTKWAYDNKENRYNPFDPEQAIPGSMKHFLLECYSRATGNGIMKLARALDIYNKGPKSITDVKDNELLSPETKMTDKHGNPNNYAYKVLSN